MLNLSILIGNYSIRFQWFYVRGIRDLSQFLGLEVVVFWVNEKLEIFMIVNNNI